MEVCQMENKKFWKMDKLIPNPKITEQEKYVTDNNFEFIFKRGSNFFKQSEKLINFEFDWL